MRGLHSVLLSDGGGVGEGAWAAASTDHGLILALGKTGVEVGLAIPSTDHGNLPWTRTLSSLNWF